MAEHQIINRRDWSDLPSDILFLIAKKLPDLLDFVHFHVTCKSWCASSPISDFPLHFPWLLEFHQNPHKPISVPTTKLRLYSTFSDKIITIPIKESRWFRGMAHHYIPLLDDHASTISLFNPLTNDEFVPPPVHDSCRLRSCWMVWTEPSLNVRDRKILIVDEGGYVTRINRWAMYDPHHGKWIEEKADCNHFCYCRGMFFSTYVTISTKVFDVSTKKLLYRIPPPEVERLLSRNKIYYNQHCYRSYVVESCGEVLRVYWHFERDSIMESEFHIYRLNSQEVDEHHFWVKIDDIGDQILFLEVRNGFSMPVASWTGLRGGHIYFINPFDGKPYVYEIGTGTVKTVPCPLEKCTWFIPGLR